MVSQTLEILLFIGNLAEFPHVRTLQSENGKEMTNVRQLPRLVNGQLHAESVQTDYSVKE